MIKLTALLAAVIVYQVNAENWTANPKYESRIIMLDAEEIAEIGIKQVATEVIEANPNILRKNINIVEKIDPDAPSYSVVFNSKKYPIFSPGINEEEGEAWPVATKVLFHIINASRKSTEFKFYAIYGGNDLMGIFLTELEYKEIQKTSDNSDLPYLP